MQKTYKYMIYLGLFLLCFLGLSLYSSNKTVLEHNSQENIDELYNKVNATLPSFRAKKEFETIILDRIDCFESNVSYRDRINICLHEYRGDITDVAREFIAGRPQLGLFIENVSLCPIMYNLCQGQKDLQEFETNNLCIRFERQCIDYMLDEYWRGLPMYNEIETGTRE